MKTINIAGAIDELMIFDDPEYCEKNGDECPSLTCDGMCGVWGNFLDWRTPKSKHDACKAAYWKAKTIQEVKKHLLTDEILYGESFELKKPDGTSERIDPKRITIEPEKKLCPKCSGELNHVGGCENHDCDYPPF